jgi:hypothetical protein
MLGMLNKIPALSGPAHVNCPTVSTSKYVRGRPPTSGFYGFLPLTTLQQMAIVQLLQPQLPCLQEATEDHQCLL